MLHGCSRLYADAVRGSGASLENCVGFVDCTEIKMTKPGRHGSLQRYWYCGHKRPHCLICQKLITPDGLMFAVHGLEVRRRHDPTLYRESGWEYIFENALNLDGTQLGVFGDSAYLLRT